MILVVFLARSCAFLLSLMLWCPNIHVNNILLYSSYTYILTKCIFPIYRAFELSDYLCWYGHCFHQFFGHNGPTLTSLKLREIVYYSSSSSFLTPIAVYPLAPFFYNFYITCVRGMLSFMLKMVLWSLKNIKYNS